MALDGLCVTSRGHVLFKHTGNPSGWFLTLLLNSVVMYMTIAMAWLCLYPDSSQSEFEKFVHAWVCGDDSLIAVHIDFETEFTSKVLADVWAAFGLKAKSEFASRDFSELEYCGATSVRKNGRWARRPRVAKFIDGLTYTLNRDPLYRLQRAVSISHELWPVPEREIVEEYIDFLCKKYKWLGKYRRVYSLSEAELANLHVGVEGALCNDERAKKLILQGLPVQSTMTKTKSQKEKAKASSAATAMAVMKTIAKNEGTATVAQAAAKSLEKKSKKKGGWWSVLSGAAKVAADLAPIVGPMLLANHGPTLQNIRTKQVATGSVVTSSAQVAPLATGQGVQPIQGVYDMRPKFGKDGRMISVTIEGVDFLTSVSTGTYVGETLVSIDLNVYGSQFVGTRLQREATLYERYRIKRMVGLYQPSCPATTGGSIIMYMDTDPADHITGEGNVVIQKASAHAGSEVGQVWQMVCSEWVSDNKTQDYYADADGSDERLVSPGNLNILVASPIDTTTSGYIGNLFIAYEVELLIPQIEGAGNLSAYALLNNGNAPTGVKPFGDGTWDSLSVAGTLEGKFVSSGLSSFNTFYGFSPGSYLMSWRVQGTGLSGLTVAVGGTTDVYQQTGGYSVINSAGTIAMGYVVLSVSAKTTDYNDGCWTFTSSSSAVSGLEWWITSFIPSSAAPNKKKTLQDYERELTEMRSQFSSLVTALRETRALPSPSSQLAPAAASVMSSGIAGSALPLHTFTSTGW